MITIVFVDLEIFSLFLFMTCWKNRSHFTAFCMYSHCQMNQITENVPTTKHLNSWLCTYILYMSCSHWPDWKPTASVCIERIYQPVIKAKAFVVGYIPVWYCFWPFSFQTIFLSTNMDSWSQKINSDVFCCTVWMNIKDDLLCAPQTVGHLRLNELCIILMHKR